MLFDFWRAFDENIYYFYNLLTRFDIYLAYLKENGSESYGRCVVTIFKKIKNRFDDFFKLFS